MNNAVVDTSVWVSRLSPHEANFQASRLWMEQYITLGGTLFAPTFLLVEIASALSRRNGQRDASREAVNSLADMKEMQLIPLDVALIQSSIDIGIEFKLRAGDTIYVATAYQRGIPLISWDKEQLDRASRIITTYSPTTYIF